MKKTTWVFLYIKYSKFWSVSLEHFVERKLFFMKSDEEMIQTKNDSIQSKNESQDNNVMDTSQDLFGDFE